MSLITYGVFRRFVPQNNFYTSDQSSSYVRKRGAMLNYVCYFKMADAPPYCSPTSLPRCILLPYPNVYVTAKLIRR